MTREVLVWVAGLFLAGLSIVAMFCSYQTRQRKIRQRQVWWGRGL